MPPATSVWLVISVVLFRDFLQDCLVCVLGETVSDFTTFNCETFVAQTF